MNKKINFGTDGIRGHADSDLFLPETITKLGIAIAKWSLIKYKKENPKLLIGTDTRISSPRIKKDLINGLANFPLHIIDAYILPTPAVCKIIQTDKTFDFGIVISASHNPYYDNGIKLLDAKNSKLNIEDEKIIINHYQVLTQSRREQQLKQQAKIETWKNAPTAYQKNITSFFEPNFLAGIKVVLDCANGATYKLAPEIFKKFGAKVITINHKPDGTNINKNCGALHTENLQETVVENKADIGFAFDGDGDRIMAVNKNGEQITGDEIIALLTLHSKFNNQAKVVGTIVSNLGLDFFLKKQKKELVRTPVGDKHVAAKLIEENLLLGGENSGHIIMKDYMNSGDGIFASLRIMETILLTKNLELKTFKKIPQISINIPVNNKKDLTLHPYVQIIQKQKDLLKDGRIIVRYSGTENLLRIMVEDESKIIATHTAQMLAYELQEALR
jgi:phosphoglucosamine mutase